MYATTIHAINSCVIKLSKLAKAVKVYRGLAGGVLPTEFWRPNEHGVKGTANATVYPMGVGESRLL